MERVNDNAGNWLSAFIILIFSFIISVFLFFSFAFAHGDLNPLEWSKEGQSLYLSFALAIIFPCSLNYLITQKGIDLESEVDKIFDCRDFVSKKYLDIFLIHYGNVATTGLLLMGLIYTLKAYSNAGWSPIALSVFTILIFTIYSLFLLRLMLGMRKYRKLVYFPTMMIIIVLDLQLIEMFIKSVPDL